MNFRASNAKALGVMGLASVGSLLALLNLNPWWILASFVAFQFYWIVGLSVGNHRYFTHRSFKTSRFWEEVMIWAACTSQSGHPGMYAIVHLEHHRLSDKEDDPHLWYSKNMFSTTQFKGVRMTRAMKKAFVSDPLMMRIYDTYILYPLLTALVLMMINPWLFVYLWAVPTVLMQFTRKYVTIKWIHQFGYQTYDVGDNSKNSKLLSLLFGGEGLHNNHHRFPGAWDFSVLPGEIDPGSWFVRMIKK